jgi:adenosine deaminase CECR1
MARNYDEFLRKRESIILETEKSNRSSRLKLSEKELRASLVLEKLKDEIHNDKSINLMDNLYDNFPKLETTNLFKALKGMPKGVLQHVHFPAAMSFEAFLKAFTFNEKIYYSVDEKSFKLFPDGNPETGYRSVTELRAVEGDEAIVRIMKDLIIFTHKEMFDHNVEKIFSNFDSRFMKMGDPFFFTPVLKSLMEEFYNEMVEDGIDAVEIRNIFGFMINDNQERATVEEEIDFFKELQQNMASREQPLEVNYIHTGVKDKQLTNDDLKKWIDFYRVALEKKESELFVGFDMVSYEGKTSLGDMAKEFFALKREHPETNLILHAGEDVLKLSKNIIDAILLGSKRIGHGLAIVKNPAFVQLARKHDVCVEINPISNYMLGFFRDPFNHPLRTLINSGIACTINSDDFMFWNCSPLTMDFLVATIFSDLSLREIKYLIYNSIQYSFFNTTKKFTLRKRFEAKWEKFVDVLNGEGADNGVKENAEQGTGESTENGAN